jgi:RNA polymerase sigma-70 factor (ECF subfamily)
MNVAATIDDLPTAGEEPRRDEMDAATHEACCRRDRSALQWWVARYERVVFAFVSRSMGAGPHVEDVAQEVFARAFQALPGFDPHGPARLTTWMLAIARNVMQESRRKNKAPVSASFAKGLMHDPGTPDDAHHRKEIARAFELAADALPEDQRDAFVLAHFHGLTMAEIAEVLGVPESTAKTKLFRAREKLRVALAPVREA